MVAALDETTTNRMTHVILRPPTADNYEHLKAVLLSCYDLSDGESAAGLEDLNGSGDRRPSDLLAHMLTLNGDSEVGVIFRERISRHLLTMFVSRWQHYN